MNPTQPHLAVSGLEDLLGEVLVDHRGLQAEAVGSVDVVGGVVSGGGGVDGGLIDGEIVQLARLALVEEQCAVDLITAAAGAAAERRATSLDENNSEGHRNNTAAKRAVEA